MTILTLGIVAAFVAGLVQILKNALGTHQTWTVMVLIAVSLVGAWLYFLFGQTHYWTDFLKILVVANTIYGVIIKPFEAPAVQ